MEDENIEITSPKVGQWKSTLNAKVSTATNDPKHAVIMSAMLKGDKFNVEEYTRLYGKLPPQILGGDGVETEESKGKRTEAAGVAEQEYQHWRDKLWYIVYLHLSEEMLKDQTFTEKTPISALIRRAERVLGSPNGQRPKQAIREMILTKQLPGETLQQFGDRINHLTGRVIAGDLLKLARRAQYDCFVEGIMDPGSRVQAVAILGDDKGITDDKIAEVCATLQKQETLRKHEEQKGAAKSTAGFVAIGEESAMLVKDKKRCAYCERRGLRRLADTHDNNECWRDPKSKSFRKGFGGTQQEGGRKVGRGARTHTEQYRGADTTSSPIISSRTTTVTHRPRNAIATVVKEATALHAAMQLRRGGKGTCIVVVDSGASCHLIRAGGPDDHSTNTMFNFQNRRWTATRVRIGDGATLTGREAADVSMTVEGTKVTMRDARLIQGLTANLLSVRVLMKDGWVLAGKRDEMTFTKGERAFTARLDQESGLYILAVSRDDEQEALLATAETWHARMCHVGNEMVEKAIRVGALQGGPTKGHIRKAHICEACILGKSKERPMPRDDKRAAAYLELLHIDVWGDARTEGFEGVKYLMVVCDDHTSWVWTIPLQGRWQAAGMLVELLRRLVASRKGKGNETVHAIRTDQAREFSARELTEYCAQEGIAMQKTTTGASGSLGRVERQHRTNIERTVAMQSHGKLDRRLWADAAVAATYVQNRVHTKLNDTKTPYEKVYGKKPDVSNLRVFGCAAYINHPRMSHIGQYDKLDARATLGVLVGYGETAAHYKIRNADSGKATMVRDVTFIEDKFPTMNVDQPDPELDKAAIRWLQYGLSRDAPANGPGHAWATASPPSTDQATQHLPQATTVESTKTSERPEKRHPTQAETAKQGPASEEKTAEASLTEAHPTLRITKEKGDGACFYRAIARSVTGDPERHGEIRKAVCEAIKKKAKDKAVRRQCRIGEGMTVLKYAAKMEKPGVFATDLEVETAAEVYELAIDLYTPNKINGGSGILMMAKGNRQGKKVSMLYNGTNHYDTVTTQDSEQQVETGTEGKPLVIDEVESQQQPPQEAEQEVALPEQSPERPKEGKAQREPEAITEEGNTSGGGVSPQLTQLTQATNSRSGAANKELEVMRAVATMSSRSERASRRGGHEAMIAVVRAAAEDRAKAEAEEIALTATAIGTLKDIMVRDVVVPTNSRRAQKSEYWDEWKRAMEREWRAQVDNESFEKVRRERWMRILRTLWTYAAKGDVDGKLTEFKARLVIDGSQQRKGVDFDEVFAPAVRFATVRLYLALAAARGWAIHQMDVKTAFLNASLKEKVYVAMPEGVHDAYGCSADDCVLQVKKAVYGLVQAPREWNQTITNFLEGIGLIKSNTDPGLFASKDGGTLVTLYVDDILVTAAKKSDLTRVKEALKARFKMTDIGPVNKILGVSVDIRGRSARLGQQAYVEEMLAELGVSEQQLRSCPLPFGALRTLSETIPEGSEGITAAEAAWYAKVVGKLLYLARCTRPDLAFTASVLARFVKNPRRRHLEAAHHATGYVQATKAVKLVVGGEAFTNGLKGQGKLDIVVHGDADLAGDTADCRSTTGTAVMVNGSLVDWRSKKQSDVAKSTCEAELYAMDAAAADGIETVNLLRDMHIEPAIPMIYTDNLSTLQLVTNPGSYHYRTRHIRREAFWVAERIKKGDIGAGHVRSAEMVADALTKVVRGPVLHRALGHWGLRMPESRSRRNGDDRVAGCKETLNGEDKTF